MALLAGFKAVGRDRQLVADKSLRRPQARRDDMSPVIGQSRLTDVHSLPALRGRPRGGSGRLGLFNTCPRAEMTHRTAPV